VCTAPCRTSMSASRDAQAHGKEVNLPNAFLFEIFIFAYFKIFIFATTTFYPHPFLHQVRTEVKHLISPFSYAEHGLSQHQQSCRAFQVANAKHKNTNVETAWEELSARGTMRIGSRRRANQPQFFPWGRQHPVTQYKGTMTGSCT
jgi:hypothetical protein